MKDQSDFDVKITGGSSSGLLHVYKGRNDRISSSNLSSQKIYDERGRPFIVNPICYHLLVQTQPKVAKEVSSPSLPLGETGD